MIALLKETLVFLWGLKRPNALKSAALLIVVEDGNVRMMLYINILFLCKCFFNFLFWL